MNMDKLLSDYLWVVILVLLVTVPLKAAALWRSARRGHVGWFLALIILNTLGILDVLYIFIFSSWGLGKKNSQGTQGQEKEGEEQPPRQVRQANFSSSSKSRTTII